MAGFDNDICYANNADFSTAGAGGGSEANGLQTNGQLWIGRTAVNVGGTHISVGNLISPLGTLSIGYSAPNITLDLTGGSSAIETIAGDTGSISGNNVTIYAHQSVNNSGATVKFVNSGTISTFNVTDASSNTMIGLLAGGLSMSGNVNTGLGAGAGAKLTTGQANTFIGVNSGSNTLASGFNVGVGYQSLTDLVGTGSTQNTALGANTLTQLSSGTFNTAVGYNSGVNYTGAESNNILIRNTGTGGDSNVIRIGVQGSGAGQQNQIFVAGITGVTSSNPQFVTINSSTGQLGVATNGIFAWTDVTSATQTLAVNNGYVTDRGGGVTYTLPSTASLGDIIKIVGKLGLAVITPNANQQILIGPSSGTVGVTGTATSNNVGDCIELICITSGTSTVWRADSVIGTWTLA